MKICENKRSWSLFSQGSPSITILDISKATGPVVTNFYRAPLAEGRKVCSNSPGHMTNMAAMPVQGKNLYKSLLLNQWIDCLEI